jgi:hypothetical protein
VRRSTDAVRLQLAVEVSLQKALGLAEVAGLQQLQLQGGHRRVGTPGVHRRKATVIETGAEAGGKANEDDDDANQCPLSSYWQLHHRVPYRLQADPKARTKSVSRSFLDIASTGVDFPGAPTAIDGIVS